jgi:hypothetical protein
MTIVKTDAAFRARGPVILVALTGAEIEALLRHLGQMPNPDRITFSQASAFGSAIIKLEEALALDEPRAAKIARRFPAAE